MLCCAVIPCAALCCAVLRRAQRSSAARPRATCGASGTTRRAQSAPGTGPRGCPTRPTTLGRWTSVSVPRRRCSVPVWDGAWAGSAVCLWTADLTGRQALAQLTNHPLSWPEQVASLPFFAVAAGLTSGLFPRFCYDKEVRTSSYHSVSTSSLSCMHMN